MRAVWALAVLGLVGCATQSRVEVAPMASVEAPAYRAAVDQAFADLEARTEGRAPAGSLAAAAVQNFSRTQSFEVVAYPKTASFDRRDRAPGLKKKLGEPVTFRYQIDRQGRCAIGARELNVNGRTIAPLVRADQLATCVQIEIKPVGSTKHDNQYVRVFMTPDYRVYGVSYHDLNSKTGNVKSRRTTVKWDQSEPLSSDSLTLSKQFVPLDLPIYATNAVKASTTQIKIAKGSRTGETCSGWKIRYHNTFGSFVKADWCESDPWPTVVETDRYIAYLSKKVGG